MAKAKKPTSGEPLENADDVSLDHITPEPSDDAVEADFSDADPVVQEAAEATQDDADTPVEDAAPDVTDHNDGDTEILDAADVEDQTSTDVTAETVEATPDNDHSALAAVPPERTHSFWPAVFGGVVAAALGFIAGRGDMLDAYLPRAEAPAPVDLAPVTEDIAALAARIGQLESVDPVDMSAEFGAVETALDDVTARVTEIEQRPQAPAPAAPTDNSGELAALETSIADLEARLADEDARASAEAARILARAALTRVITAVESGETFEPALGALEEVAPIEVPEILRVAAAKGVPSMSALREDFPEAARAGLTAARAEVPETEVAGIGNFLKRQLSVRSVTPRDGSDPDAILSRVEAALKLADLDTALAEIEALPDAAKTAMQGWLAGATSRKQASDAAKSLSDSLTVN